MKIIYQLNMNYNQFQFIKKGVYLLKINYNDITYHFFIVVRLRLSTRLGAFYSCYSNMIFRYHIKKN